MHIILVCVAAPPRNPSCQTWLLGGVSIAIMDDLGVCMWEWNSSIWHVYRMLNSLIYCGVCCCIWCKQVVADVFGVAVYRGETSSSASLGAAYRALHGWTCHSSQSFVPFRYMRLNSIPVCSGVLVWAWMMPACVWGEREMLWPCGIVTVGSRGAFALKVLCSVGSSLANPARKNLLAWYDVCKCVCVCVCEREREREREALKLCVLTLLLHIRDVLSSRSSACCFTKVHDPDMDAHLLYTSMLSRYSRLETACVHLSEGRWGLDWSRVIPINQSINQNKQSVQMVMLHYLFFLLLH